ncbi:MAG TPA: BamA/TamA family outer membrane protein [Gemmatimonadaceae bacterium]|nr:BamA/TamA family outer membrane protein [Gemmatimonadaceae bacterium]
MSRAWWLVAAVALMAGAASSAAAQVAPNARWRTIDTEHFRIHFTPELEATARRAAVDAESAYAALAERLHPPRGTIDLVVADNVDYSNGYTTTFPTNRIVVYTHPPLDSPSLHYYDDWLALVITHELTHSFHLDRTRGWWRVAQRVFGRAPFLFPNQYEPGWMTEGLATYFESAVTGTGRTAGTFEKMLLEASVAHGGLLPFDRWNLSSTRYPGPEMAYGFGALFFDYLARTRGPESIGKFVETASGATIPFRLDRAATRSFGISFHDAWHEWRDSLEAQSLTASPPLGEWSDLSRDGRVAFFPRWLDSASLVYSASNGYSSPGAYLADTSGRVRRIGRRNDADINTPLPDGALLYSQLEFTDPYHVRADLYVQRDGEEHRLTHGARLAQPDARSDGAIVAVRYGRASTQLVRVSADGSEIAPVSSVSPDTQWAEPRWSPSGDRIAVMRWTRGAYTDVVVLDTLGNLVRALTHDRAYDSAPSWSEDGSQVLFTSNRTGKSEIYIAPADGDGAPRRVSRAAIGVFYPGLSPDGRLLAAVRYDYRGWHVGYAPFDSSDADTPPVASSYASPPLVPARSDSAPARDYSPWRSLLPRYWIPLAAQTTAGGYSLGAFTSGNDIVGRHSYFAQLLIDPADAEHTFDAGYRYAGFGQPLLDFAASQYWDRAVLVNQDDERVGDLMRRSRTLSLGFTVRRPRVRNSAIASVRGELEMRRYSTEPGDLLSRISDQYYHSNPRYWSLVASASWSNTQRPPLSISPEDGISFAATGRLRWLEGVPGLGGSRSQSVSALANAYKSIPAGGFAHHVLALHVAGGAASGADPGEFNVGGSSGTPTEIFPGFTIGSHHTFAVRGFPSGTRSGRNVAAGSLEYRAPLTSPERGLGFWPVFLDRTSVALFTDAGTAWGSGSDGTSSDYIASAGAELDLDTGLQYDVPYRLRLGLAFPLVNRSLRSVSRASVYFQLGYQF